MDERIAWGLIPISDSVLAGETFEDWYSLNGKQGDEKEGMINLVFAYRVRWVFFSALCNKLAKKMLSSLLFCRIHPFTPESPKLSNCPKLHTGKS